MWGAGLPSSWHCLLTMRLIYSNPGKNRCDENYINLLRWSNSIAIFPQSVFSRPRSYHLVIPGKQKLHTLLFQKHCRNGKTLSRSVYSLAISPPLYSLIDHTDSVLQRLIFISEQKVIIALHFVQDLLMC